LRTGFEQSDYVALLLVDPTGERDQDALQRMRQPRDGGQATRARASRRLGPPDLNPTIPRKSGSFRSIGFWTIRR